MRQTGSKGAGKATKRELGRSLEGGASGGAGACVPKA